MYVPGCGQLWSACGAVESPQNSLVTSRATRGAQCVLFESRDENFGVDFVVLLKGGDGPITNDSKRSKVGAIAGADETPA
jgi:hypothetical protein